MKSLQWRLVIVGLLAVALVGAAAVTRNEWKFDFAQYQGPPRKAPKDEFRFVIVGDRTGGRVPGLMPQGFRELNHLYPDFVISVGDLIDGPSPEAPKVQQFWKEFDSEVALLQSPFVYVPGNHDIWDAQSKTIYEQRYGPRYRSFDYRGLHFIVLNTEELGTNGDKITGLGEEQLKWLAGDIEKNRRARRNLVFLHKPIWQGGSTAFAPAHEILRKADRVNVFAGHLHRYSYEEIDGIPYMVLGAVAGGISEEGDATGRFRHYVLATMLDNDLKLALVRLGGVLSPEAVMYDDLAGVQLLADAAAAYRTSADGDEPVRLVFRNPLDLPVRVEVQNAVLASRQPLSAEVLGSPKATLEARASLERTVQWQVAAKPTMPTPRVMYRFENRRGQPQSIDFPVDVRTVERATAARLKQGPTIDGQVEDWGDARWHRLGDASQVAFGAPSWSGPEDLSGQFAVTHDGERLYVAVRVVDDNVAFNSELGNADGAVIYLARPGKQAFSFHTDADWHRLTVAPFGADARAAEPGARKARAKPTEGEAAVNLGAPSGPARVVQSGKQRLADVRAAYHRQDQGYTLEVAIPLASLGLTATAPDELQLDIGINDRDLARRRETLLVWSGTGRDDTSSRYYGRVALAK